MEIKLKIYRLQIFDYNYQSDPLLEYHCKFGKINREILVEKAVDYWKKNLMMIENCLNILHGDIMKNILCFQMMIQDILF